MPLMECDSRTNDGLTITLLWDSESGETAVTIEDADTCAILLVPNHHAAECFRHPFAYVRENQHSIAVL